MKTNISLIAAIGLIFTGCNHTEFRQAAAGSEKAKPAPGAPQGTPGGPQANPPELDHPKTNNTSSGNQTPQNSNSSNSMPTAGKANDPTVISDSKPTASVPFSNITTAQKVTDVCESGQKVTKSFQLKFAATDSLTGKVCKMYNNGTDDIIRGYYKQTASVELPQNAVVCKQKLTTLPSSRWSYDDEVILTLNQVVLLASQREYLWKNAVSKTNPIMTQFYDKGFLFDWEKLAALGLFNNQGKLDTQYCYGGSTDCRIPITQKEGDVSLTLNTKDIAELSLKAIQEKKLTFDLWVTGDNDPDIDCRHSGITIDGSLEYVIANP